MDQSKILDTIKGMIGIANTDQFNDEIIPLINSEFSTLYMIGVGPEGFAINTGNEPWTSFTESGTIANMAKEYIALKVQLIFDPPSNSFVNESKQKRINELEWRLRLLGEPGGWDK